MSDSILSERRPHVLVAIASYGLKNIEFLKRIIAKYQSMSTKVDVVVLSEAPKDLGPEVEVVVGLPSANPWSLPFAHKAVFAQNVDKYDLFAYSEDDMEVTEANIQAFLRVTQELDAGEIAGYLRYERDPSGVVSLPDVHGNFHWKPESVRRRKNLLFAEFTNEHAAFYLLTRSQLKRAIDSGGFLRDPCEGRYDMLCTAATDPYTNCGFRKVICLSEFDNFLIHHVPNRYAGQVGLPLISFKQQIDALTKIGDNAHPVSCLCPIESKVRHGWWSKSYYESPSEEFIGMLPQETKTLLSIGCGWGEMEATLVRRGIVVTALPLDSVIGATAAAQSSIEMIYASFEEAMVKLNGRQFDAILLSDLLHLLPGPFEALDQCARLLRPGGALLLAGPNFDYLPILARRMLGAGEYRKLRSFSQSGIHPLGMGQIRQALQDAGLQVDMLVWQDPDNPDTLSGAVMKAHGLKALLQRGWRLFRQTGLRLNAGRFMAQKWNVRAIKRG